MTHVGIKLSFGRSNLVSHIRWLEFLAGDDFHKEIVTRWRMPSHLAKIKKIAQEVVDEDIYSVQASGRYRRTKALRRSIKAVALGADAPAMGQMALYFDPSIAPAKAKVTGRDKSQINRAAFFDRPAFNSFIKAESITDPIRSRPFYLHLESEFQELEEREAMRAIMRAASHKRPRTISK